MTILSQAVAQADRITKQLKLQQTITYVRAKSLDETGAEVAPTASPVKMLAIVELKSQQFTNKEGIVVSSRSQLTFLDPVAIEKATAGNGFSTLDTFILPDGTTGPVVSIDGPMDAGPTPYLCLRVGTSS